MIKSGNAHFVLETFFFLKYSLGYKYHPHFEVRNFLLFGELSTKVN